MPDAVPIDQAACYSIVGSLGFEFLFHDEVAPTTDLDLADESFLAN